MPGRPWTVLPHDPIRKLEDNLWAVEGDLPGMPLRRWMVLIRLGDGRLVIHNAVALGDAAMREIEAWGEPAFLIVPNPYHRMDAWSFKQRYPAIRVLCPQSSADAVRKRVEVDGHWDLLPPDPSLAVEPLAGVPNGESVFLVRSGADHSRATAIFTDAVFNQPHFPGFKGLLFRLVGSTGSPRVTWLFRMAAMRDRALLASHLHRLSSLNGLVRVIPGHGQPVEESATDTLRSVALRLSRSAAEPR